MPEFQKHVLFTFSASLNPEIRDFPAGQPLPSLVKPFEVAELIFQARNRLSQNTQAASGGNLRTTNIFRVCALAKFFIDEPPPHFCGTTSTVPSFRASTSPAFFSIAM